MISNKKGMILYYFIIPGFIIAFVYFLVLSAYINPTETPHFPGELQLNMLSAAQFADEMLIYIEEAAKIAAYSAVRNVTQNGGFSHSSPCTYYGYNMWSPSCMTSINDGLEQAFNDKVQPLIDAYPQKDRFVYIHRDFSLFPKIEPSYYKLFSRKNELFGAANKPLSVNLYFDKGLTGFYSIRPDFHVKTSYDFDTFNIVQEKIKQIIGLGKTDARARLEQSFQAWNAADSRLTWEARACLPETAEELFWEVVEHVQRCINSRKDDSIISCRCNLSRVDFSLLGDEFEVVLEQSDTVVARLQKNGASVLEHTLDGAAKLGYHPPQEEFSVSSLKPSNTLALRWNGANNIYFSGIDAINGISPHLSIFRNKISDHDTFAFIPDPSRTILYEQFSECPLPEESTLRLCVSTGTVPVYNTESGKMVQKPVKFKLAADLRK